jgi:membrane-associated phospholipid phosphatase
MFINHLKRLYLRHFKTRTCFVVLASASSMQLALAGNSEIVSMPTGRLEADGVWHSDFTYGKPYATLRTEATVLPWLQGGFGFVRYVGLKAFVNSSNASFTQNYGDNKDKTVFGRIKLSDESAWMPATALILRDPIGTSLFKANAIAASKRFDVAGAAVDVTVGYGTGRIQGVFGGVSSTVPGVTGLKVLVEKDAIDYRKDAYASQIGLSNVRQPIAYGLEYKPAGASWGAKISKRMQTTEFQLSFDTDNHVRDIMAKQKEYLRFRAPILQPNEQQWLAQPAHERVMRELLHSYGFEQVSIQYDAGKVLTLGLSHARQLHASAAVGDAVHIALKAGPREMREIAVRYLNSQTNLATAQYVFTDIPALQAYIAGQTRQLELLTSVRVSDPYPLNNQANQANQVKVNEQAVKQEVLTQLSLSVQQEPELSLTPATSTSPLDLTLAGSAQALGIKPRSASPSWGTSALGVTWNSGGDQAHRITFAPKLSAYLNGPGVFQYAVKAGGQYDGKLTDKTFATVDINKTVYENITQLGIAAPNGAQPNVRSRTAYYEAGKDIKLDKAVINRFEHLDQNVYGRLNAGFFERQYAGVGGQVLWAPKGSAWSADVSVDALAQRSETKMFGLTDYKTVTAIGSLHYRLPMDVLVTARAGRFLAKDVGVRVEFLRRFWGGIELGAWASVTNAKDFGIDPNSNYRDKGLMVNIPFDSITPYYSKQVARMSLSPWTRDIAQMVRNPADLYELLEEDLRSKRVQHGLERFSGVVDYDGTVTMGALAMDDGVIKPVGSAARTFTRELEKADLGGMARAGAVFTLGAALSDRSVNRWVNRATTSTSQQNSFKQLDNTNTALTVLGLGTAALWAYDGTDWQRSNAALASLEASGTAVLMATGIKYLTDRARPSDGLGASSFGSVPRGNSSFLSRHMALSTALVTPLALHYDAPVLYALPALTALARLGTRQHWASDVAAGGALGYALGNLFYKGRSGESAQRKQAMFNVTRDSITITIPTE